MNERVIRKVLTSKFNDFCKSIKDENVKKLIEQNTIITGGSIASMLINEKVKDFDLYFTDKKTCLAVAKYYINLFNQLHPQHKIPPSVRDENGRIRIFIQSAGITSDETNDEEYQYFEGRPLEEGEDYVEDAIKTVQKNVEDADRIDGESMDKLAKENYMPVFLSDNAITLSGKIQIVIRFYGNATEIHENFDFVHCKNYWKSSDRKLVLRKDALNSLLIRQLFYVGSKYPICSLLRIRKFLKKGWHINAGEMLKISLQISELNLYDINVLDEQLTGVDTAYFRHMLDFLRQKKKENDNLELNYPYVVSIIDKIF